MKINETKASASMLNSCEPVFLNLLPPTILKLIDPKTRSPHHVFIFGMTGSGKSSTVKKIISSKRIRRPLLILDWAGEYGDLELNEITPTDLSIEGLESTQILDAFSSAYQLTKPQEALLLKCLGDSCKISELVERVRSFPVRSASEAEMREALLRRLEPLEALKLFEGNRKLSEILKGKARLNLSHLPFEARRLTVNVILRLLYNYTASRKIGSGVIVVEEAENLVPPRRPEDPPTGAEVIVNELRKWGVSVIGVAQLPSQVNINTFRNCEYLLIHRVRLTPLEASLLGLELSEVDKLARLDTGKALLIHRGIKRWIKVCQRATRD